VARQVDPPINVKGGKWCVVCGRKRVKSVEGPGVNASDVGVCCDKREDDEDEKEHPVPLTVASPTVATASQRTLQPTEQGARLFFLTTD